MSISAERSPGTRIVTALLRDGNRILLCHRSPRRRWYPDFWDLPGGHVEPGELPGAALARELREELGIDIAAPSGPPVQEVRADTFDMQIWLIEAVDRVSGQRRAGRTRCHRVVHRRRARRIVPGSRQLPLDVQ